jgi:hypothetical protein
MTDSTPPTDAAGYLILPANKDDALSMLRIAGIALIGPAIRWLEDNDDPGNRHKWLAFHDQLNTVGYGIKELTGVDVGAGGGGKGPGGGG